MKVKEKGFVQIPHSFLDIAGMKLKPSEQLVYIHLSRFCYANRTTAFPSQARLADLTGLSLSTVGRAIKGLVAKEAVVIVSKTTNGRWLNKYRLLEWSEISNLDDRIDFHYAYEPVCHDESETKSKCDGYSSQNDRPTKSKCDKKNKNQEYEMNNKNFAADATKPSASHEAPKEPNEKNFTGKSVPLADSAFNNAHKPKDISRFEFPNASLKEIQEKIYFWFREHDPQHVHMHKKTLYLTSEELLPLLIQGYSYLDVYWKDYGYGDRSLIMFLNNLTKFCCEIENMRFDEDWQWRCDNRMPLLREFIRDHGLFDVTDRKKMITLMNGMKTIEASGRTINFNETQRRYLDNYEKLFAYKNLLKDAEWGGRFEDYELKHLTDESIYKQLRTQQKSVPQAAI